MLVMLLSLIDAVMRKNCDEECLFVLKKQVKEQMVEEKVTWGRHVEVLQHRGAFGRTYHMELANEIVKFYTWGINADLPRACRGSGA